MAIFYLKLADIYWLVKISVHEEEYKVKNITSCLQGICSLLGEKNVKCNSKQNRLPVIREKQMPC